MCPCLLILQQVNDLSCWLLYCFNPLSWRICQYLMSYNLKKKQMHASGTVMALYGRWPRNLCLRTHIFTVVQNLISNVIGIFIILDGVLNILCKRREGLYIPPIKYLVLKKMIIFKFYKKKKNSKKNKSKYTNI